MKAPKDKKNKSAPASGAFSVPGVDAAQLERLLDFMAAHNLEEFEYEHGGVHIRLRKASGSVPAAPGRAASGTHPAPAAAGGPAPAAASASAPAEEAPAEQLHVIKSPIVGTFYSAPNPDAAPFVKVGDSVTVGQVVCIVEAMKLMNEIEADAGGEIARVLVENGQPVEYGQPLFALRPAKKKK
jgi:acetyl-CoA carboxylase biotin carboxyl carrier protein